MIVTSVVAFENDPSVYAGSIPLPSVQGPIPITADSIPFNSVAQQVTPIDLKIDGFVEEEYFLSGEANVYKWDQPGIAEIRTTHAPYTNRIVVRKPSDMKKFSGNVFVEIVNSTSTYDSQVLWYGCHDKFLRDGDIYVGITNKPIAVKALKKYNPVRYAPLSWNNPLAPEQRGKNPGNYLPPGVPGSVPETEDGLIWDIISQAGALLKSNIQSNPLLGYKVEKVYAMGVSQSAVLLTTYINAIHPIANMSDGKPVFDGYLLTVGAYPLQINQDATILFPAGDPRIMIRHCSVPVIRFMSQTDFRSMGLWDFLSGRRADSDDLDDRFRLYEVPASSHVTLNTINYRSGHKELTPLGFEIPGKTDYIQNDFPSQYLYIGALINLDKWVREGTPPPRAPFIEIDSSVMEKDSFGNDVPTIVKDQFGNALGGLRTPYVDVPIATYTGYTAANPLGGEMFYFDQQLLQQMYSTYEGYKQRFSENVDEMVRNRWITVTEGERMKQEATSKLWRI